MFLTFKDDPVVDILSKIREKFLSSTAMKPPDSLFVQSLGNQFRTNAFALKLRTPPSA
jgi:hypothetical protein